MLHFEAPITLLHLIQDDAHLEFICRYFICMFVPCFSCISSASCSHLFFLAVRSCEPPTHGQSLLTFHSADTDCVFKCAVISDVLDTKLVVQNFIHQREFCCSGFTGVCHLGTRVFQSKKSRPPGTPEPESNLIASVCPYESDTPGPLLPSSYLAAKQDDILILQTHKLFLERETLFMLQCDFSATSPDQLPKLVRVESSVDSIYDSASKLAKQLSEMHRHSSRLEGFDSCIDVYIQRLYILLCYTSALAFTHHRYTSYILFVAVLYICSSSNSHASAYIF